DPDVLTVIASACRDRERLRFDYRSHAGTDSRRSVEPYRLLNHRARWYLVAWDLDRADWRTFRADRVTPRTPTGPRFTPRPLPAAARAPRPAPRSRGRGSLALPRPRRRARSGRDGPGQTPDPRDHRAAGPRPLRLRTRLGQPHDAGSLPGSVGRRFRRR